MKRFEHTADGACGTNLLKFTQSPENLNIHNPDIVAQLHTDYMDAGSRIIRTNTFLSAETAAEGAKIALRASRCGVEVLGCIGPKMTHDRVQTLNEYRNHMRALKNGGIRHLHPETMNNPLALELALTAAKEFQFPEISLCAYLSERNFYVTDLIAIAREFGITHVGLNCMPPDEFMRASLTALMESPDIERVSIYPESAGMQPVVWAHNVAKTIDRLPIYAAGGCCGTTPAHIRELSKLQTY